MVAGLPLQEDHIVRLEHPPREVPAELVANRGGNLRVQHAAPHQVLQEDLDVRLAPVRRVDVQQDVARHLGILLLQLVSLGGLRRLHLGPPRLECQ